MRETLTVSVPAKTKRLIERTRLAIFRKLWQDAAAESRRHAVPRARGKGVFTDEDVFRLIS